MSKRSRRPARADAVQQERVPRGTPSSSASRPAGAGGPGAGATGAGAAGAGATRGSADGGRSGRSSQGPTGTPRAGRRERERLRPSAERSLFERYRTPIVALVAVVIVGAFLFVFYQQATARSYTCDTLLTPAPSAAPLPSGSPELGQAEPDMGQIHVQQGTTQHYGTCPPASGPHYNTAGLGPIEAKFYDPNQSVDPESWLHNLEHGGIVIAYSCTKGSCDDTHIQQLRGLLSGWPNSPICGIPALTDANVPTPVIVRFDDISTPYAAIVWDRVLLQQTLDKTQLLAFYQQWGDRTNPERANCPLPSGSPSAAPSGAASAAPSGAASSSPAPSGSAAPSSSAPAVSSAGPSASPSPS